MGAVNPANMSKLRPSNVISFGMTLLMKRQNRTISTGILTICKIVSVLISKPSMNRLPLGLIKRPDINKKGGIIISKNLRGNVPALW